MAGKSQKNKYGLFTNLIENKPRKKVGLRAEFQPSFCAFLMAVGTQYSRAYAQLGGDLAHDRSEPADSARTYYATAIRVIQHLINLSVQNISQESWQDAVIVVCKELGIVPESDVIPAPEVNKLAPMPEIPTRANKSSRRA